MKTTYFDPKIIIRIIFTCIMGFGVYTETGIITACAIGIIAIAFELQSYQNHIMKNVMGLLLRIFLNLYLKLLEIPCKLSWTEGQISIKEFVSLPKI